MLMGITHHSTFLCFNGACAEFSQQLSISVMGITQHIKWFFQTQTARQRNDYTSLESLHSYILPNNIIHVLLESSNSKYPSFFTYNFR
jgi:hypothetical protein